jgi:hypothetical protein
MFGSPRRGIDGGPIHSWNNAANFADPRVLLQPEVFIPERFRTDALFALSTALKPAACLFQAHAACGIRSGNHTARNFRSIRHKMTVPTILSKASRFALRDI